MSWESPIADPIVDLEEMMDWAANQPERFLITPETISYDQWAKIVYGAPLSPEEQRRRKTRQIVADRCWALTRPK